MNGNGRRLLLLSILCFAGYAALLGLVVAGVLDTIDMQVAKAALRHWERGPLLASRYLTDALSPPVDAVLLAAGAGAIAWRLRRLWPLGAALVTGWVMAVIVIATKHAVGRPAPRPRTPGPGLSFPSGHTASALVCLGTLALLVRLWRPSWVRPSLVAVGVLTTAVAAALVYHLYHWLWDCAASMLLGVGLLSLLQWWLTRRRA